MRRSVYLFLALLFCTAATARTARFTASAEWGGCVKAASFHSYNYLLDSGYRMNGTDWSGGGHLNAFVLFYLGTDLTDRWNLSLGSGYEGIDRRFRVYPVALRLTHFAKGADHDGWLGSLELGAGLQELEHIAAGLGRLAAGYRFRLTERTAIDLQASIRLSLQNPDLFDPDSSHPIPDERIARNNVYSGMIGLSAAFSFR